VRRYVPELAGLDAAVIHQPWKLPSAQHRGLGYPAPIITAG
jgi:deoxyribodipyrimidine photo-lyase